MPPSRHDGSPSHARKDAHLEIAASGEGRFRSTTTLLEEVQLVHQALPERDLGAIDLTTEVLGRTLKAPLLLGAMTGGTKTAGEMNRALARVAQATGVGLCLGSQRPMLEDPGRADTYTVRALCPDVLLVANLGALQAARAEVDAVAELVARVEADALMLHLNPAQELLQPEGDRDFRGVLAGIERLVRALPVPVAVKETGCGLSRQAGRALRRAGVTWVEVAGAGGTSWPRVEARRTPERAHLIESLGEWGIPTAASLLLLEDLGLERIAGGGIRSALDVARALALGARACSVAQPALVALREGGPGGLQAWIEGLCEGLRALCLLTGAERPDDLWGVPRVLGPRLSAWQRLTEGEA